MITKFKQFVNESNLTNHAMRELSLAGMLKKDDDSFDKYNDLVASAVIKLIELFASQGHSGFSASMVRELFNKLSSYKTLTPITSDPSEWEDVSHYSNDQPNTMWQNKRDPSCFSYDCGKTWKSVDENVLNLLEEKTIQKLNETYKETK